MRMSLRSVLGIYAGNPEDVAVITASRCWTCAELDDLVEARCIEIGRAVPPDRSVAVAMSNTVHALSVLLASIETNHPALLLPESLPAGEFESLWQTSGVNVLLRPRDRDIQVSEVDWSETISPADIAGCLIGQLTSGSMGPSQVALRTRAGVFAEVHAVCERLALQPHERVLCGSSIAHSYGLVGATLAPLAVGATIVLAKNADESVALIASAEPSVVFGVAATYSAILNAEPPPGIEGARLLLSAGAPLAHELSEGIRLSHRLPIRQDYGTTECGTISLDVSEEAPAGVGQPLSHVEVRIQPITGSTAVDGVGEIQVRGEAVAHGYLERGRLQPCTDDDGWYHTRDIGSLHNGILSISGRLRDPIPVPGASVDPESLERAVESLPGVERALVVAIETETGTSGIKVILVGLDVNAGSITRWCHENLPPNEVPSTVEVVDALPVSPAGKILRKYLPN